ncbi:MAG: hypothetical protein Rpha_0255 [Candidatus Ruthia sp. Apha_13_S6]|nr:hypothetical protein [Candidatus Ruthia sp. Apha_13_S6]
MLLPKFIGLLLFQLLPQFAVTLSANVSKEIVIIFFILFHSLIIN